MAKLKMDKEVTSEAQCKRTLNSVADALYVIGGQVETKNNCCVNRRQPEV
ncbi:MAG: hypothetical protein AVDCRST_MAG96-3347 [uncultured Segetibacter sp.]|uniref:Uncharacterized protein n=1 Tax=uncultured Segetibacter sp. TaxID=481133 RepID=A0A6J4TN20_9BACT|nr:MAG: hypothetical protein AVDCRST_MAG96-3347 [uncultured Segetibacter sp.]